MITIDFYRNCDRPSIDQKLLKVRELNQESDHEHVDELHLASPLNPNNGPADAFPRVVHCESGFPKRSVEVETKEERRHVLLIKKQFFVKVQRFRTGEHFKLKMVKNKP